MNRLMLALALLFSGALPAMAQGRGVADPRAFVAATYARYQAHPDTPPRDQSHAYSPRLRRLFNTYDAWQRAHDGEVGSIDFDWWTNAQDYQLRHVRVTERRESAARRWVIASFVNMDRHDQVRFLFVRLNGRWYLDDAMQGTGRGGDGWTLSALLRNPAG